MDEKMKELVGEVLLSEERFTKKRGLKGKKKGKGKLPPWLENKLRGKKGKVKGLKKTA